MVDVPAITATAVLRTVPKMSCQERFFGCNIGLTVKPGTEIKQNFYRDRRQRFSWTSPVTVV